jgi:xanthine dehydrogenase YagR molybdenum-binding subunit
MSVGAALVEELAVDKRLGFFVNHDLASYEAPVHADIPHQEVIFVNETDPISLPMKAKGLGELGICGVAAAVANLFGFIGIRNATFVRAEGVGSGPEQRKLAHETAPADVSALKAA